MNPIKAVLALVCVVFLYIDAANAQPPPRDFVRGLAVQGYPAGVILNGHMSYYFRDNQVGTLYIGYNLTNRRDWGEHDDERGGGAGAGLAWRLFFNGNGKESGWFTGVRTDIWFLTIDWEEDTGQEGETEVSVLQPTAQIGYSFSPTDSRLVFDVSASLGAEFNILTRGEDVGQGAIFLLGISGGYRF